MDRIDKILNHDLFLYHLGKNNAAEADRRFCRHSMVHFLDVARIYAAALLHDCGKHEQYENGTPHEQASARIAPEILKDCGFDDKETDVIVTAISRHRDPEAAKEKNLNGVLYRADKASRACFACDAEKDCNWKDGKKNLAIRY